MSYMVTQAHFALVYLIRFKFMLGDIRLGVLLRRELCFLGMSIGDLIPMAPRFYDTGMVKYVTHIAIPSLDFTFDYSHSIYSSGHLSFVSMRYAVSSLNGTH